MTNSEQTMKQQEQHRIGRASGVSAPSLTVPLGASPEWRLWPTLCVRGAGFPVDWALALALPGLAAAADRLAALERHLDSARDSAVVRLRQHIDAQPPRSEARERLAKCLRAVQQGRVPELDDSAIHHYAVQIAAHAQARLGYAEQYRQYLPALTARLQELARDARFQEAVLWQNRAAFQSGVLPLLQHVPYAQPRSSQLRQHEQLVASYVQRYALKNDSIGFFGPIAWGRFSSEPVHVRHRPGPALLRGRAVYWEGWAIDGLARSLSRLPGMRPWIAPRLSPFAGFEGDTLCLPGRPCIPLAPSQAALLKLCTGEHTVHAIAGMAAPLGATLAQVEQVCAHFEEQGLLDWSLRAPLEPNAERYLLAQLERIGDTALREQALAQLARLEQGRAEVAAAQGDPARLAQALASLDATFAELTGAATTRGAGRNYAGRTLLYEDTQRDIDFAVGQRLLERLAPPMELLLASGHWAMCQLGELYRGVFHTVFEQLRAATGQDCVDIAVFWQQVQPLIGGARSQAGTVLRRLQEHWADILQIDSDARRLEYTSAALGEQVRRVFAAGAPAWNSARYHCPDVMLAGRDLDSVERGDYQLVMGEMHMAHNTLTAALFVEQHPDPASLQRLLESDIVARRLRPIPPPDWEGYTTRTSVGAMAAGDYRLIMSDNISSAPFAQQLTMGDTVIELVDGALVARTRDNRVRFDLVEACAEALNDVAVDMLKLLPERAHQPRVSIDGLVVARECWSVPLAALGFGAIKEESERFLAARSWARATGLPRLVFVKTPVEGKPFFVDFDSPVYVELLCKAIRRSSAADVAAIRFSEMLPTPEDTWLTDAQGARYTCELRCVVVRQDG